jgi:uncharacterized iron-regulated protein
MKRLLHYGAALAVGLVLAGCAGGRTILLGDDGIPYPPAKAENEEIYHVPTGVKLDREKLLEMVAGARIVYVGEMHNNVNAHRVQLEIIKGLNSRFPGQVAIGMEMFREGQQEALDRWTAGELSEPAFLKESRWFHNWSSDFGYYRDILTYAREQRLDVVALKPSDKLQEAVRMTGLDNLTPEVREKLPEIDASDHYARASTHALYQGHIPSERMFDSFYQVQVLWEETMAQRIVEYLSGPKGNGKRLVVLTGGWHVAYGYGVPKKVLRRLALPYAIVLPEETSIPPEKQEQLAMEVNLPYVPLLRGDFIWYVPYEDLEGKGMKLGILMNSKGGKITVERVEEGSPAAKAGVLAGDQIISLDGEAIGDGIDLRLAVQAKRDGDNGLLAVSRDGAKVEIPVVFFPMTTGKAASPPPAP